MNLSQYIELYDSIAEKNPKLSPDYIAAVCLEIYPLYFPQSRATIRKYLRNRAAALL